MLRKKKNILAATIAANFEQLNLLKENIVTVLSEYNIQKEDIASIELAIYEVIANIIEHGPVEYKNESIAVAISKHNTLIDVKIENRGAQFDLTKAQLPDIVAHYKSGKNRGLGIYFIRTLMDKVTYAYKNNSNILTLLKQINHN